MATIKETYDKWKHLGDAVKDFASINTKLLHDDSFDIRLAMLGDCWIAIEELVKNNRLMFHDDFVNKNKTSNDSVTKLKGDEE